MGTDTIMIQRRREAVSPAPFLYKCETCGAGQPQASPCQRDCGTNGGHRVPGADGVPGRNFGGLGAVKLHNADDNFGLDFVILCQL